MEELLVLFSSLVAKYGLLAVGLGVFFEGETILVTAGVLASQGQMNLHKILLTGWAGAMAGHLAWFGLGRWLGKHWFTRRFPKWEAGIHKADEVVRNNPWKSVIVLQYMYGMRMIGALALGFSTLPLKWFAFAESINCLVWVCLVAGAGYQLGDWARDLLGYSSKGVLVVAVTLLVGVLIFQRMKGRRKNGAGK
jgi:membrane protein DedA with SNARE-associated domain